jgi:hypothetical protein
MKGYVNVPENVFIKQCKECGARPIIALLYEGFYVVKCPISDNHYHTQPGLIDLEDWNANNYNPSPNDYILNDYILNTISI